MVKKMDLDLLCCGVCVGFKHRFHNGFFQITIDIVIAQHSRTYEIDALICCYSVRLEKNPFQQRCININSQKSQGYA